MQRKPRSNGKRSRKRRKIQKTKSEYATPKATPAQEHCDPLLVSIAQAARMLNRCEAAVFILMRDGQLKALKIAPGACADYVEDAEWLLLGASSLP
jgi:hypothetical protein